MNCFIPPCRFTKCSNLDSVYCAIKNSSYFCQSYPSLAAQIQHFLTVRVIALLALLILCTLALLEVN